MRALIDGAVFVSAATSPLSLARFFHFAATGRHVVLPDPIDAPEFQAWLQARDPKIRKECEFAITSSLDLGKRQPPSLEIRITTTSHPRWTDPAELPLDTAHRMLEQPMAIVVEGSRNDRDFLLATADRYQRQALESALQEHWIRFDHGGGLPEMFERLQEMAADQERLKRTFWIFDSDALAPAIPSPESERLAKLCRRKVNFHQLERRTAENYLPIPALQEIWPAARDQQARKKKARAFARLSPEQRHHYNMKTGLDGDRQRKEQYKKKKRTAKYAKAAEQLFSDLADTTQDVLRSGFGAKICDLFRHPRLRNEGHWFESDGLRSETRPMIETLLAWR